MTSPTELVDLVAPPFAFDFVTGFGVFGFGAFDFGAFDLEAFDSTAFDLAMLDFLDDLDFDPDRACAIAPISHAPQSRHPQCRRKHPGPTMVAAST